MPDYHGLVDDLEAEEAELDAIVDPLDDAAWSRPTPAAGWSVHDSIGHLAWAEELATTALHDAEAFQRRLEEIMANLDRTSRTLDQAAREKSPAELLQWWRDTRRGTVDGLRERDAKDRVPWIVGPMSAMSFATARLMETWAHGQDVVDGLGIERAPTARLRHVADIGVRTRRHAYVNRGLDVPDGDVRVELTAPDGPGQSDVWTWGDSETDVVRGPAVDFCLVATQRRNVADTALEVTGPLAQEWMAIAQAFAGPPTDPRPPRS